MKEGEIIVTHGADWFGVFKVQKIEESEPKPIAIVIFKKPDHREYREYNLSADGQLESTPIFVQRLKAESREAAEKECVEIRKSRDPLLVPPPVASKEAERAREAILAKTDFGPVLEAINANDPALAAKVFGDIAAAFSNEPHEDDKASVVRLRKLIKQRKAASESWHLLVVAHWDELLPKEHGEISLWLAQHGEAGVSTSAVSRFIQRLGVKRKKATK